MGTNEPQTIVAISAADLQKFGCPYCGYRSGYSPISGHGAAAWDCGECGRTCCILGEGNTKSSIGFGSFYPELQDHPRHGIPKRGRADKQPDCGGEFFRSRGIGLDITPGCFVCGGDKRLLNNIAAFVQCKEAGVRVVNMFQQGARLDYRDFEPDRVQVKVGACNAHLPNLRRLDELTRDGVITSVHISEAVDRVGFQDNHHNRETK